MIHIKRPVETWTIRKPAIESHDGVVVTQHYAASKAGAQILAEGGNAVDAAIAASLALASVEPWMSGLGGGGYMIVSDTRTNETSCISFGMVAPERLNPADYPLTGTNSSDMFGWPAVVDDRNVRGPMAIAIPGQLAGLSLAHQNFSTKSWADLVTPALTLAQRGITVDWYTTLAIAASAKELARDSASASIYLRDGQPPAGQWSGPPPRITLINLAETLARLAKAGPQDFYEGEIARDVITDCATLGIKITANDLSSYCAEITKLSSARYRQADIWVAPGLTAGPTLLSALNILTDLDLTTGTPDPITYLAYANALQEAYADRFMSMGDQSRVDHASCTSHLSVADQNGTVVALTQTLLSPFGSKVTLPKTGILMNNGIMWFDPRPGTPNSMAPRKQPLSNMCPTVIELPDGKRIALGASGGRRILPSVLQLLSFIVDFGMSLDDAIHYPRINVSGTNSVEADPRLGPEASTSLGTVFDLSVETHGVYPAMFACPNAASWKPIGVKTEGAAYVMSPNANVGTP